MRHRGRALLSSLIILAVTVSGLRAGGAADPLSEPRLAQLRARGPEGLKALLDEHADALARGPRKDDPSWRRLSDAIDRVAMQKDAWASGLYWHTDLEAARAAAAREEKPILSLRLLGKLSDDLSCANSRYFRTTLYPDPRIATLLRGRFILHWSSERPVPVVTVDFGDGRVMKRTVTGNSAHYVLNLEGHPIDVLPGLFSAAMFERKLKATLPLFEQVKSLRGTRGNAAIRAHHQAALTALTEQWKQDLAKVQLPSDTLITTEDPAVWRRIANAYHAESILQPAIRKVVLGKSGAEEAARVAVSKTFVESPIVRALMNLERTIAEDTVRNAFDLHRRAHEWFIREGMVSFEGVNQFVYSELFLTPRSDPWLGLAPADGFSALEGEGLVGK